MTTREYNKTVDLYADDLFRFILKNIKDEEKARDVVQDAFEKLWIKSSDINPLKVKSYLFTSAYHTMIDEIRKEKRALNYAASRDIGYEEPRENIDLTDILNDALDKLPEIQRSVLILRDYEGYSYQEIGGICNLSESQVKVYIYRARIAMKNYIGKLELVL